MFQVTIIEKIGQQAFDNLLALEQTLADANWPIDNKIDWFLWFVGLDPKQDHQLNSDECVKMVSDLDVYAKQMVKNVCPEPKALAAPLDKAILEGNLNTKF